MQKRAPSLPALSSGFAELDLNESPPQYSETSAHSTDQTPPALPQRSMPDLRTNFSLPYAAPNGPPPTQSPYLNTTQLPPTIESEDAIMREGLLQPPPTFMSSPRILEPNEGSRPSSRSGRPESRGSGSSGPSRPSSRPQSRARSPSLIHNLATNAEAKLKKRRSWLPKSSHDPHSGLDPNLAQAWIVTPTEKIPYDMSSLVNLKRVEELWDDGGNTLVYLHNGSAGPSASFRLDSSCFASSKALVKAAYGDTHPLGSQRKGPPAEHPRVPSEGQQRSFSDRTQNLMPTPPKSPPQSRYGSSKSSSTVDRRPSREYFDDRSAKKEVHLCLPQPLQADPTVVPLNLTPNDTEVLLNVRNLFAFLTDKPLVATTKHPSMFAVFMQIADLLQRYEFTNFDGSTIGEEAESAFARCIANYRLADIRASREKTLEAILLGERMKCWDLYNEGFVHAVGKYDEISAFNSPKTQQINTLTRKRMERSHLFLSTRLRNVRERLEDFDFPSLFAGFANSTSSTESKIIHFKTWKNGFLSMRRHVMGFYKQRYGAWPPKARSKKNNFEESGLNRVLLKEVYQDLCDLYDVLADRSNFTTRAVELASEGELAEATESSARALRRLLGEYDRSTPPVQPPIPFDTPLLPSLSSTRRGFEALDPKKQKKESLKKLDSSEINTALMQSYNRELMKSTPFLEAFFAYERRSAQSKSMEEIADLRNGQWLLVYAVIQALPLLVVDAPGLRYTDGVEYFLSEFSKESPPWMAQDHRRKTTWRIAGSDAMVDMPAASVEYSLDAIYQRSHCWKMAEQWAGPAAQFSQFQIPDDELLPPTLPSASHSRNNSQSSDLRRLSMGLGLEQLPLPSGVSVSPSGSRPVSLYDPSKSFNSILGLSDAKNTKKA
ncbi:uncharacterized protein KY384_006478 [Bacidia gigantensis]|uniref:uncharacterized protein n=1 Tax=Bacidia gigantensis TaxID=2732470 RepID=UPI001D05A737|nr:uncharacterized protein KY384_006478 [Bacidia gigantensis]KAG8528790.1 hypothetical protein KY384_006478 [Bacidia gigantensis]